jgi:hypothetical protein
MYGSQITHPSGQHALHSTRTTLIESAPLLAPTWFPFACRQNVCQDVHYSSMHTLLPATVVHNLMLMQFLLCVVLLLNVSPTTSCASYTGVQ